MHPLACFLPGPHSLVVGAAYGSAPSGLACAVNSSALDPLPGGGAAPLLLRLTSPLSRIGLSTAAYRALDPQWLLTSSEMVSALQVSS